jgi:hypothetical protein
MLSILETLLNLPLDFPGARVWNPELGNGILR